MKKAISIILLCISVFSFCIPPISAVPAYVHGDIDRDGKLTIIDAEYIQRVIAMITINDYDVIAADC